MGLIGSLQTFFSGYSSMELLSQTKQDETGKVLGSYIFALVEGSAIATDVCGSRTYQNSYTFRAKELPLPSGEDFLEGLMAWCEGQEEAGILPVLPPPYMAQGLFIEKAALIDIGDDGKAIYQVQIRFTFTKERDEEK